MPLGPPEALEIPAWTTWERGWPVVRWDDDGNPHGVSLDGYTIRAQVRPREESETVLHEWSTALGNVWTETRNVSVWDLHHRVKHEITTDLIVLHVDPEDSGAWTWRSGEWDIKTYAPEPDPWEDRIASGTLTISPAVTRP